MKIFQREQRSLFGEILDWMLTPLLLLWPVSLALTWLVAQSIAGKPFDRALEYNVQALAQLVSVQQQRVVFNLPQPAREILRADDSDKQRSLCRREPNRCRSGRCEWHLSLHG